MLVKDLLCEIDSEFKKRRKQMKHYEVHQNNIDEIKTFDSLQEAKNAFERAIAENRAEIKHELDFPTSWNFHERNALRKGDLSHWEVTLDIADGDDIDCIESSYGRYDDLLEEND